MQPAELTNVLGRLHALENQNRWLQRGMVLLGGVLGLVLLVGSQLQGKDAVGKTDPTVILDTRGVQRAWLGMDDDGPALRFRDANGKERLWLGVAKETPGLVLFDDKGKRRAALATSKDTASLVFYDGQEKIRSWLLLSEDTLALNMEHNGLQRHTHLSLEKDCVAVWYHDQDGKLRVGPNEAFKNMKGVEVEDDRIDPLKLKR